MKTVIYGRISGDNQRRAFFESLQINYCKRVIENGIIFLECHNCGWVGIGSTISKDLFYPYGKLKRYPKVKCPKCN